MSDGKPRTAAALRRETIERAQSEGLAVAYETALAICRDANAPAPAKATAIGALFRIGGGFEKHVDPTTIDPEEMTAEQLDQALARIRADIEERKAAEQDSAFD